MTEWREFKIKDIADVVGGGTPSTAINEYWNGDIPWLTPKDLTGYIRNFISHGERFITKKGLENSSARLLPKGTVLLTSRAPIGYVAIAENEICTNQGFKSLVPNPDKAHNLFLLYWIKTNVEYLQSIGTGTTFQEISGSVLKDVDIILPPLPEQKAIAEVLSSLDDKIDLLTRQNKTLEDLGQAYFRKWFVETEVQTGRLDSIAEIIMGQSPKGDSYNEDGFGTVFFQGRAEFGWRFPTVRLYTTSPQRMAKKGDILMSVRAPVGDINIAAEDCCIGRGLAAIRSEYPTFTLYAIKEQQDQLDIFNGEGTVFGSITKDGLSSLSIPMPDKKRIQEFEDRFSILDEKIKENSNQILTLQKLRDTLLPKLISGEVRVSQ
jgi:type I restriction enzyme S subunit